MTGLWAEFYIWRNILLLHYTFFQLNDKWNRQIIKIKKDYLFLKLLLCLCRIINEPSKQDEPTGFVKDGDDEGPVDGQVQSWWASATPASQNIRERKLEDRGQMLLRQLSYGTKTQLKTRIVDKTEDHAKVSGVLSLTFKAEESWRSNLRPRVE